MGVLSYSLPLVFSLLEVSKVHALEPPTSKVEPPTIEIGVTVVSNRQQNSDDSDQNSEFWILVDTWWKILAWSAAVLTLSCLCCYFSRCCYLCWDCFSDPFWGCFPHSEGCTRCLLMKGNNAHLGHCNFVDWKQGFKMGLLPNGQESTKMGLKCSQLP